MINLLGVTEEYPEVAGSSFMMWCGRGADGMDRRHLQYLLLESQAKLRGGFKEKSCFAFGQDDDRGVKQNGILWTYRM